MLYGLMYSGGVDSIVCLKLLRDQNITPILFHISYPEIKRHLHKIKKNALLLSPNSPFYVWKSNDYQAVYYNSDGVFCPVNYRIVLNEKEKKYLHPTRFVDFLICGYFKQDNNSIKHAVEYLERREPKLLFPLTEMSEGEIEGVWKTLPKIIRTNTITTSRESNGEWIISCG